MHSHDAVVIIKSRIK